MNGAHLRTVSMPDSKENSGGGGVLRDRNESRERVVSAVVLREESVSSLLTLLLE